MMRNPITMIRATKQPRARNSFHLFLPYPLDTPARLQYHPPYRSVKSPKCAQIAQSVEQRIENPRVAGSIPALGTIIL